MSATALGTILFYLLAAVAVALAVATVATRHIFRAALFLMGTLSVSAAFYIMLGAEFLAGVQILVYVGGIVVLLVFAVLLTASRAMREDRPLLPRRLLAGLTASVLGVAAISLLCMTEFRPTADPAHWDGGNTAAIGRQLLDRGGSGYVLPFEIISLLLLGVVLGAIVIARKTPPPAG